MVGALGDHDGWVPRADGFAGEAEVVGIGETIIPAATAARVFPTAKFAVARVARGGDEAVAEASGANAGEAFEAAHFEGNDDLLAGFQTLRDALEHFVSEIRVADGRGEREGVGADQAAVGDLELAGENVAGAHVGQVDNGWLDRDDGDRNGGVVGGFEENVVTVLNGRRDDFPFERDEAVFEGDLFGDGDAGFHLEPTDVALVLIGADSHFVTTGGKIFEEGFADGIAGESEAGVGIDIGFEGDLGTGEAIEGGVRLGGLIILKEIADVNKRVAIALFGHENVDAEFVRRGVGAFDTKFEGVGIFLSGGGGLQENSDLAAGPDREGTEGGGPGEIDPGRSGSAIEVEQAERHFFEGEEPNIFELHRLGHVFTGLDAGVDHGRGDAKDGSGVGEGVIEADELPTFGAFVGDQTEIESAAGWGLAIAGEVEGRGGA